jgi:putative aldouronate transport system permease protein
MILYLAALQNVPQELLEAARIDGAGELTMLWRVVLPLSKAVLAVVSLFYAVAYWNRFFEAIIYFNDQTKWPIGTVLRQYVTGGADLTGESAVVSAPQATQMAVVVLATAPIVCIYPLLQRYFVKGVLTGAVKA